jgi:hypothetical protein
MYHIPKYATGSSDDESGGGASDQDDLDLEDDSPHLAGRPRDTAISSKQTV